MCKDPEAVESLVCSRNNSEASVPRWIRMKGRAAVRDKVTKREAKSHGTL